MRLSLPQLTALFALMLMATTGAREAKAQDSIKLFNPNVFSAQIPVGNSIDKLKKAATNNTALASAAVISSIQTVETDRLVGGSRVDISQVPWQVALVVGDVPEPGRILFCGGSFVAQGWVITAAHCVDRGTPPERVNVIANTSYYRYGGERVNISSIFVDPYWNGDTKENDIALLRLKSYAPDMKTIGMASDELALPENSNLTISGWGAVLEGENPSDLLLEANVPLVSNAACNASEAYAGEVKAGMLCAGYRNGGVDACQGDSGGPAVALVNGVPTLVGIVSWGEGCARKLKYGVYTKVSAYRSWVDSTIATNP